MCPRCSVGIKLYVPRKLAKYEISKSAGDACALTAFVCSNKEFSLWKKIFVDFIGISYVSTLASTCRLLNMHLNDDNFWQYLCVTFNHFNFEEEMPLIVYPNVECPEGWRGYFLVHQRKIRWLHRYRSNAQNLPSFLASYHRIQNPVFGNRRVLATNDVVFIKSVPNLLAPSGDNVPSVILKAPCLLYDQLEVLIVKSKYCVHTLQSGLIAYSMQIVGDTSGSILSEEIRDFCVLHYAFVLFYSSDIRAEGIMYSDIGECICKLALLAPDGSAPLPVNSISAIEPTPHQNLPFEVYYVQ